MLRDEVVRLVGAARATREICRVEWVGAEGDGREQQYVSHEMSRQDADAMAAMLRRTTARQIHVVLAD